VHGCEDSLGAQAQSAGEGINGSLAMDGGGGAALFWAKKEAKRGNDDNGQAFYRRLKHGAAAPTGHCQQHGPVAAAW
jgi:hypothetical protein